MSALEFRDLGRKPGKSMSLGHLCRNGDCSREGYRRSARFRVAICGRPILTEKGEPLYVCARCRQEMENIWNEASALASPGAEMGESPSAGESTHTPAVRARRPTLEAVA